MTFHRIWKWPSGYKSSPYNESLKEFETSVFGSKKISMWAFRLLKFVTFVRGWYYKKNQWREQLQWLVLVRGQLEGVQRSARRNDRNLHCPNTCPGTRMRKPHHIHNTTILRKFTHFNTPIYTTLHSYLNKLPIHLVL